MYRCPDKPRVVTTALLMPFIYQDLAEMNGYLPSYGLIRIRAEKGIWDCHFNVLNLIGPLEVF